MKPNYYKVASRHLENAGIDFRVFDIYNPPAVSSSAEIEAVEKILKCHNEYMAECWDDANLEHVNTLFSVALCDLTFKAYGVITFWNTACQILRDQKKISNTDFGQNPLFLRSLKEKWNALCDSLNSRPVILRDANLRQEFFEVTLQAIRDSQE